MIQLAFAVVVTLLAPATASSAMSVSALGKQAVSRSLQSNALAADVASCMTQEFDGLAISFALPLGRYAVVRYANDVPRVRYDISPEAMGSLVEKRGRETPTMSAAAGERCVNVGPANH